MSSQLDLYFDPDISRNYSIKKGHGEIYAGVMKVLDEFNKTEFNFDDVNIVDSSNKEKNEDFILDESILLKSPKLDSSIILKNEDLDEEIKEEDDTFILDESILLNYPTTGKGVSGGKQDYSDGYNPYSSKYISSMISKKINNL